MSELHRILLYYLIAVNLITFAVYGADKSFARRGSWRIPEKSLLFLALIGGGIGAYTGMRWFHHKTKKPLFRVGVPILLVLNIVAAAVLW